ncbi:UDP-3-O-(3-hydroxymyristoyl)glucosamine N-acyltransferase [Waterburya agarophytonicola K14]|uniref:UDP-3-O-acylglucosamine N-acyltransferase n=1 Tax=Waterburya agarophytonicola KI4 TaxID=2874699 RepID=A0A964FFL3_9CYAN|nr:UDP-3-O-(3-hydroxymyristoyl)glucosamine N-acyltransferase [Waterburya agarophytonicola KI4]
MQFQEIITKLGKAAKNNSLNRDRNLNPEITGVAAIDEAISGTLSYVEGGKFTAHIATTEAGALILPTNETLQSQATSRNIAWIATPQPRLLFAKAISLYYKPFKPTPAIHPSAVIDPNTRIGQDVYIGANVVIQAGVIIGDRVTIHPNVVIYPDVTIGEDTILHANCTIHERTQIGSGCTIHSGAAIGSEGFGFVPTAVGWYKMEQSGYTVLEDGVEVGCNSAVDRPAVGETRIGSNTKIDNLVQIGHGCKIGRNCAMASQVGLAGGVIIGNGVMLGGQVGVANQVTIGDRVIATGQTGITGNVPAGEMVSGMPHIPTKIYRRLFVMYKKLPEIYQEYKKLQQKESNQ